MSRTARRIAAIIVLSLSISLIIWASLPNKRKAITQIITPDRMQLSPDEQRGKPLSIPARQVKMEWPVSMRIGEQAGITLSFIPVAGDAVSQGVFAEHTDIYSEYSLMAEGRFDEAGMKVDPATPRRESMPSGQPIAFKWVISADKDGSYDGTVWLSLRYLPLDGSKATQVPIYIQDIKIKATSLAGMSENTAYLLGGVGLIVSAGLFYNDLLALIRKMINKMTKIDTNSTKGENT